jgi:hypothetical protein
LEFIYGGGIQSLTCYMIVYGNEATTKYEELQDERRFDFSMPYHLKHYDTWPFMALTKCFHDINLARYIKENGMTG